MTVSPDALMTLAGKEYCLNGSFNTLKELQAAFGKDIVPLQSAVHTMRLDEFAKLLAVLIRCSGQDADEVKLGEWLVDEVGIVGQEQQLLRLRVMAFLAVAMTPNRDRQKKRADMAKVIEEATPSHGENTDVSA